MDDQSIINGLLRTAREVLGRSIPLDVNKVKKFKSDFNKFMKNVSRADTYEKAMKWQEAMNRWNKELDEYLYKHMLGELKNMVFRDEIDESSAKYWDGRIREETWSFVISAAPPINRPDSYWNKEMRFDEFQKKLPKWERRIRNLSRKAWNVLREFAEWFESQSGQKFLVNEPMDDNVKIQGLDVIIHGADELSDYMASKMPEMISELQEGLKRYKEKASKTMPLLMRMRIPVLVDFKCSSGEGGEYLHRYIMLCPKAFGSPNRVARIMAHEMGHHIYYRYLTRAKKDLWSRFISGNYGELNLLDVANKLGKERIYDNKKIKSSDPILYLQLMGLYDAVSTKMQMKSIFDGDGMKEAIESGALPEKVNVNSKPISGYASKNAEEAFCEALASLVVYGPNTVFEEVREVLRLMLPI